MREDTCATTEEIVQSPRKPWHAPKFAVLAEIADETKDSAGTHSDAGGGSS